LLAGLVDVEANVAAVIGDRVFVKFVALRFLKAVANAVYRLLDNQRMVEVWIEVVVGDGFRNGESLSAVDDFVFCWASQRNFVKAVAALVGGVPTHSGQAVVEVGGARRVGLLERGFWNGLSIFNAFVWLAVTVEVDTDIIAIAIPVAIYRWAN